MNVSAYARQEKISINQNFSPNNLIKKNHLTTLP